MLTSVFVRIMLLITMFLTIVIITFLWLFMLLLIIMMLLPIFHLLHVLFGSFVLHFALVLALFELKVALMGHRLLHMRHIVIVMLVVCCFLMLSDWIVAMESMVIFGALVAVKVTLGMGKLFMLQSEFSIMLPILVGSFLLIEHISIVVFVSREVLLILSPIGL